MQISEWGSVGKGCPYVRYYDRRMRPALLAAALCILVLGACGRGKGASTVPSEAEGVTEAPRSGQPRTASPTAPSEMGLTESNCEALLDHIFKLVFAHKIENVPEAERPSPEDVLVAKDKLRSELFGQCLGADRAIFAFDCAMAATSADELGGCMGEKTGG